MKTSKRGFTMVELMVVIGISLVLFGFVVIGLSRGERTFSTTSTREKLISDLKTQQTKAMQGIDGPDAYGIYFQPDRYTLFKGYAYSSQDPDNYEVELDEGIVISDISFPASVIVFATRSGEIDGFVEGNNTMTIQDTGGLQVFNLILNRYGIITNVN